MSRTYRRTKENANHIKYWTVYSDRECMYRGEVPSSYIYYRDSKRCHNKILFDKWTKKIEAMFHSDTKKRYNVPSDFRRYLNRSLRTINKHNIKQVYKLIDYENVKDTIPFIRNAAWLYW